jgi:hypothetical protein
VRRIAFDGNGADKMPKLGTADLSVYRGGEAHQLCWPVLQALFIRASVLPPCSAVVPIPERQQPAQARHVALLGPRDPILPQLGFDPKPKVGPTLLAELVMLVGMKKAVLRTLGAQETSPG